MDIDFIADTVCVRSYIAKRRLEKALTAFPGLDVRLTAHPLSVLPSDPYLPFRFTPTVSPAERTRSAREKIEPYLAETGIEVRFDRLPDVRSPFLSHMLVRRAFAEGKGMKTLEAVFKAYFTDGRDIGDLPVLLEICRESGGDEEAFLRDVERREPSASFRRPEGLRGVPAFLFDGKLLISGAQSTDVLIKMIQTAALLEREKITFCAGGRNVFSTPARRV